MTQSMIFNTLRTALVKLYANRRGATAVEYGLLVGLMAIGVAAATGELATITNSIFDMLFEQTSSVTTTSTGSN